jgi:hypothetical protein
MGRVGLASGVCRDSRGEGRARKNTSRVDAPLRAKHYFHGRNTMQEPEQPTKLRMIPAELPEQLARRVEREKLSLERQREINLEQSLNPFRVGSVPYLNAVPLTRGIEDEIVFVTPAKLAEMLRRDELDAALVSITEVLFNDRYDVLDGVGGRIVGRSEKCFCRASLSAGGSEGDFLRRCFADQCEPAQGAAG